MADDQRQSQPSPQPTPPLEQAPAPQGEPVPVAAPPAPQGQPVVANTPAPQGQPVVASTATPHGEPSFASAPAPQGQPIPVAAPAPQGQPVVANTPAPPAPQGQPLSQHMPTSQGVPQSQQILQEDGQRKHVHHSYIWLSAITVFLSLFVVMIFTVGPLVLEGVFNGTGMRNLIIGIGIVVLFVVIVGLTVFFTVLSYRNLYYELGEEEFNLYSGIINKKRVHVPYQRIQSVNQRATLIQRIIGVCTIHIDTAGGASNKAITVPYLQNTEAEKLRNELFARKQMILSGGSVAQVAGQQISGAQSMGQAVAGQAPHNILDAPAEMMTDLRGVFGSQAVDTGTVTYQYGLSNKELFLSGLSNSTGFALIVVSLIGSLVGIAGILLESAVGRWAYESGLSMASELVSSPFGAGVVVVVVIVALLIFWLFSILGTCISYGGFKATRRGSRIEVSRGLLQHRFQGVDVDRVQSVIVKQSFIRKIFGYCELSLGKIDAMTGESNEQQQNMNLGLVVHPFVKMDRVPEILAGLVPEFADVPTEARPLAKQALRRAILRRGILTGGGFWLAVIVTFSYVMSNTFAVPTLRENVELIEMYVWMGVIGLYVLCLLMLILEVIGAVLWYRGSSYAYNRTFMQVTNGGFSRESVSFPRKKIQYGFTQSNPFQRRAHVKTINARTAAGVGGTTLKLLDVRDDEANEWLSWVKPRTTS